MSFEFVLIPDQYVVFVLLALFFFVVFFIFYFPTALSLSIAYLLTYLRRLFALCCHPC
jgi:hypothetical protein